ncbi:MAG: 5'-nucleotidase C-terminal domain-containing protein [Flavicella sp.]
MKIKSLFVGLLIIFQIATAQTEKVVIFAINDQHGRIDNFSKIKTIIDAEKAIHDKVYFVSAGDIFSGNPIVDYATEKGYPMIDLMNKTGIDISVIGNHEFDYGQEILNNRIKQAEFPFICDNMSGGEGAISEIKGHQIIEKDGLSVAFIGVVETGNSAGHPLTHPKKIKGLQFTDGLNSFAKYQNIKTDEDVDVVVALTHHGSTRDRVILENFNYVDLAIGGHTNREYGNSYADAFQVMSGKYLEKLSKTTLMVRNKEVISYAFEMIDLNSQAYDEDPTIANLIEEYNNKPEFYENIGFSEKNHSSSETGCFYTDALRQISGSDIVVQNNGGIRNRLNYGIITPHDIYSIDPFGNGFDTFTMTPSQLENFFQGYSFGYAISSRIQIVEDNFGNYKFYRNGMLLGPLDTVTLSANDYMSSDKPELFGTPSETFPLTTAEYLVQYTRNSNESIAYDGCNRWEDRLSIELKTVSEIKISNTQENLKIFGVISDFSTIIYTPNGQQISTNKNDKTLNIGNLKNGVYFLRIIPKNTSPKSFTFIK